jgi:predicted metal-binding membrane protein
LLDWGVNEAVRQSVWLGLNGWVLGAIVLGIAGVFQFTDLKYRCLDRCRAPLSFVLGHWRGGNAQRQALVIGAHHGIYCVGCCWALMLLMFIVGTGSVGWMLLLGAVMAIEKNLSSGRLLGKAVGGALIVGAAIVAFQNDALSLL